MRQTWADYEAAAEHGPLRLAVKVIIGIVILSIITGILGFVCGNVRQAANVAQEEFGARALLDKYEWFKDASAQLDKKIADVSVYDARVLSMKEAYGDAPRSSWSREDREQYNVWVSEAAGVRASFNSLAAEYNAQMAKFNYRFANVGGLPQGATTPLPREYKPYITE